MFVGCRLLEVELELRSGGGGKGGWNNDGGFAFCAIQAQAARVVCSICTRKALGGVTSGRPEQESFPRFSLTLFSPFSAPLSLLEASRTLHRSVSHLFLQWKRATAQSSGFGSATDSKVSTGREIRGAMPSGAGRASARLSSDSFRIFLSYTTMHFPDTCMSSTSAERAEEDGEVGKVGGDEVSS